MGEDNNKELKDRNREMGLMKRDSLERRVKKYCSFPV